MNMKLKERIAQRMVELKLMQTDLVRITGASKGTVSNWVSGKNEPNGEYATLLAKTLKCNFDWLNGRTNNLVDYESVATWDSLTPLAEGEVEIPYWNEVYGECGDGIPGEDYSTDKTLRLPISSLEKCGVPINEAVVARASGDSNYPMILDGMTVAINKADKTPPKNPDFYWIKTPEGNRIKLVSFVDNTFKLESFNEDKETYPDQIVTIADIASEDFKILGRIFMWSYLNYKR